MPDREVTVRVCTAQGLRKCRTIQKTQRTLLLGLLLVLTLGAQAQRVTGIITNYAFYGHGMVCSVPLSAVSTVTTVTTGSGTENGVAARLLNLFSESHIDCFKITHPSGMFSLGLEPKTGMLVTIVWNEKPQKPNVYYQIDSIVIKSDNKVVPESILVTAPEPGRI